MTTEGEIFSFDLFSAFIGKKYVVNFVPFLTFTMTIKFTLLNLRALELYVF
jgi:hypothetical protein